MYVYMHARPRPIMLKFLPIMLLSIAQKMPIMLNIMLMLFQKCKMPTTFIIFK